MEEKYEELAEIDWEMAGGKKIKKAFLKRKIENFYRKVEEKKEMWKKSISISSLSSMSVDSNVPSFSSISRSNDSRLVVMQSMSNEHISSQEDSMNLSNPTSNSRSRSNSSVSSSMNWGGIGDDDISHSNLSGESCSCSENNSS